MLSLKTLKILVNRVKERKSIRCLTLCLMIALAICGNGMAQVPPFYISTDLGGLSGGPGSKAWGINSAGKITGNAYVPGNIQAFIWVPTAPNAPAGSMSELGALSPVTGPHWSYGWAISAKGPVGEGGGSPTTSTEVALFYGTPHVPTELALLPYLPTLIPTAAAYAINDAGLAVGKATTMGMVQHAVQWEVELSGSIIDLNPTPPAPFVLNAAYGVNKFGHIVGYGTGPASGSPHAFLYNPSSGVTDLDSFISPMTGGDYGSVAFGINDSDQVVGWFKLPPIPPPAMLPFRWHAFLYDAAAADGIIMKDLGVPSGTLVGSLYFNSFACRINNSGVIVGWANTDTFPSMADGPATVSHAFVWDPTPNPGGTISASGGVPSVGWIDLNFLIDPASGMALATASDINDSGQIVGTANKGVATGYLLTPPPPSGG